MDSEKEEQLLNYLNSLGFYGDTLKEEILYHTNLYQPVFSVNHRIDYGEEAMLFRLRFERDLQFDAYRLASYKATHQEAITIDHKTINDVDTGKLEQYMKIEDWPAYFSKNGDSRLNEQDKASIEKTIEQLNRLSSGQNFDGIKIQQELMFKYWPEDIANLPDGNELKYMHQRSRDFSAGASGICTSTEAYLQVSGRFNDLLEKMMALKLDQYANFDTYSALTRLPADNPKEFLITCFHNNTEAYGEFSIPVTSVDGWYSIDEYRASLWIYPEIEHGVFNGINTLELEKVMQSVDWSNDGELFVIHDDREPEFYPKIDMIQQQIFQLQQDEKGAVIADLFQLKYWQYSSFFEALVRQEADKLLESLPKIERYFPCEVDAGIAWNLLCGRTVLDSNVYPLSPSNAEWLRLDTNEYSGEKNLAFTEIYEVSHERLSALVQQIPTKPDHGVVYDLTRGNIVPVTLYNGAKVLLQANPEHKTIDFFTPENKPIPINLNFDPDWKPLYSVPPALSEGERIKLAQPSRTQHQFRRKKGKGKGI
ncbi:hypothetical protein [Pedobacter borealis]|uniref:hypothetical protein n=1 Tax=Pedobacter borealis TaxID=475254 RepID=UPI0004933E1B|nr:hypothetical protein [Pedobacter borealis]